MLPEVSVAPVGGGRGAAGTVVGAQGLRGHHKRGRDHRRVHTENYAGFVPELSIRI